MKKILITGAIFLICAIVLFKILLRPSALELASKAEVKGDHAGAITYFIRAVLEGTEALKYPDKSKAITETEAQWKEMVGQYLSLVCYAAPMMNNDFGIAIEGIIRCTSFVDNVNFITEKKPRELPKDSLTKEWFLIFTRNNKNDAKEQRKFIDRALKDTLSVLQVRALNGYIYHLKLLDLRTGKRTDVILYPNSTVSLLVKPREYLLICMSEVQFTEGLTGKTWRSSEEVISIKPPEQTSIQRLTLKTKVHRSK